MADDQSKQPARESYELYKQLWDASHATIVPGTLHKTRLSPDPEPPPGVTGGEPLRLGWNSTKEEIKGARIEWLEKELENADNEISRLKSELTESRARNKAFKQDLDFSRQFNELLQKNQRGAIQGLGLAAEMARPQVELDPPGPACPPAPPEVTHPPHYTRGGIECKVVIEAWELNYYMGTALKYICRADYKGDPIQDLQKAIQFLQFEVERRAKQQKESSQRQYPSTDTPPGSYFPGPESKNNKAVHRGPGSEDRKSNPFYGPGA